MNIYFQSLRKLLHGPGEFTGCTYISLPVLLSLTATSTAKTDICTKHTHMQTHNRIKQPLTEAYKNRSQSSCSTPTQAHSLTPQTHKLDKDSCCPLPPSPTKLIPNSEPSPAFYIRMGERYLQTRLMRNGESGIQ